MAKRENEINPPQATARKREGGEESRGSESRMRNRILTIIVLSIVFGGPLPALAEPECGKLDVDGCYNSKGCVIECTGNRKKCAPYKCRAAKDKCESSYSHKELSEEKCRGIGGCDYEAAFCFCIGPVSCFCGGGAPQHCHSG
jgi:hypothetical protein